LLSLFSCEKVRHANTLHASLSWKVVKYTEEQMEGEEEKAERSLMHLDGHADK
jgi:hypothetical protein